MAAQTNIYQDIAQRTGGDIYVGVVGPVRTGKSTLIKRFMDTLVIPNIGSQFSRERAIDELPQSASGRTIMTTEPKFIPEDAVRIKVNDQASFNVRMIDCVGYIVPSSIGYIEDNQPRMVKTPWFHEPIPFNMAAEIGTQKVITEHSTIGIVVTTDGSISDIPREEYAEAEERVISELKEIDKPFVVILNCVYPNSANAQDLAQELKGKYDVPVLPLNCMELTEEQIKTILSMVLFEFPVKEIRVNMPKWLTGLEKDHWLRQAVMGKITKSAQDLHRIREVKGFAEALGDSEYIDDAKIESMELGNGSAKMRLRLNNDLFYRVLGEKTGVEIKEESALLELILRLVETDRKYEHIRNAMDEVTETGYGIVMPSIDELSLEAPEITHQGGKYGIRLKASAPSIHMMRADITTEVAPIVGSEKQSEELVNYLMTGFDEDPLKIWESNIFGKSLNELVNEGLRNKLYRMPAEARMRLKETLERIINEGCSGLICIIL
ncbi:MAG: stage IV sporulation protein A [Firmicutes bacterium]|nr:stage IV sporulation protein A [Bacillota bacterium]